MSTFGAYSAYYDALYEGKDYAAEADYVLELLAADQSLNLLELGCGTGAHAQCLVDRGHKVTGIDLSDEMLTRARRRAAADGNERMAFHQGDARSWRGSSTFDAVISLFHVMSYQPSNADLSKVFETAATHLPPGGKFVFDYWFGPAVLSIGPSVRVLRQRVGATKITRIAEPTHRPLTNQIVVSYDIAVEGDDGSASRFSESHPMRYLFIPEIEAIAAPFFTPLQHCGWLGLEPPDERTWAGVTVMERKA